MVTGNRLVETKTSEIATNVSQQQIRSLPQTDRNFLSFAALAPGVRYNDSETDKSFTSGASTASQVNVFVDGVSLKNKLREGGVAGQLNSRGNPFGQTAVQEFRVLTQNYKAEYEEAGSAIITAITKSGTNDLHGEVFGQYTDRSLSEKDAINRREELPKPAFERKQYGGSLGGPIIKDRLFFFGAYEGNDQDRAFNVIRGGSAEAQAEFEQFSGRSLSEFEGAFVSPFRGDFYFGKLTFTPDDRQIFDVSYSRREETDIQGFGGQTAFEAAENKINVVSTWLGKWTYDGDDFLNELSINFLDYLFNPTSLNPDLPQFEYAGVITFGGKDSTRREVQKGYTISPGAGSTIIRSNSGRGSSSPTSRSTTSRSSSRATRSKGRRPTTWTSPSPPKRGWGWAIPGSPAPTSNTDSTSRTTGRSPTSWNSTSAFAGIMRPTALTTTISRRPARRRRSFLCRRPTISTRRITSRPAATATPMARRSRRASDSPTTCSETNAP